MMSPSCLILILNIVHGLVLNPDQDPAEDDLHNDYIASDADDRYIPAHVSYTSPGKNQDIQSIPLSLRKGIAYIKLAKVGGSTWAGVMRRIGLRHGLNHAYDGYWVVPATDKSEAPSASVWANHGSRRWVEGYLQKLMPDAFYVTVIRDPTETAMSHFYFTMSHSGSATKDPTKIKDATKIDYLRRYSAFSMSRSLQPTNGNINTTTILSSYKFFAVTERMDECLLVLGKRMGLQISDLLYVKSKDSNAVEHLISHPPFAQESQAVRDASLHLQTGEDAQLYNMVNELLDKAIVEYGTHFQNDLERFQTMLSDLSDICPPTLVGVSDCIWRDNGCSQGCIDDYVSNTSMTGFFQ